MSLIKSMRRQKAIYWKRGVFDHYGVPSFDDPIEVDCRWEDVNMEFLDPQGNRQMSRSVVYVDCLMVVGDRLAKGPMESYTPANPINQEGTFEIKRFDILPNLKNTENLYTAYF